MPEVVGKLEHQALLGGQPFERDIDPFAPLGIAPRLMTSAALRGNVVRTRLHDARALERFEPAR